MIARSRIFYTVILLWVAPANLCYECRIKTKYVCTKCTLYMAHSLTVLRLNPKFLMGDKVNSGRGLRSTLAYRVAHGKCVGVDSGVDIRWGYILNSGIGSNQTPCFSLDSASAALSVTRWSHLCLHVAGMSYSFHTVGHGSRLSSSYSPTSSSSLSSTLAPSFCSNTSTAAVHVVATATRVHITCIGIIVKCWQKDNQNQMTKWSEVGFNYYFFNTWWYIHPWIQSLSYTAKVDPPPSRRREGR